MQLGSLLVAGCLYGALLAPARHARAAEVTAPASAATVLALIVTNNRGPTLGRPELRYADDDGAKYYELFESLGEQNQIVSDPRTPCSKAPATQAEASACADDTHQSSESS